MYQKENSVNKAHRAPINASNKSARSFVFNSDLIELYCVISTIPKSSQTTDCVLLLTNELRNNDKCPS
ncbi:hypothetical protein DERP_013020 [Dermatophagoides pteronyssinus]|uniref:Uncharacterized protein n=1 Tax=Dermatophagoides pteronyssinus TaxID=6956 RepID=A0ABQ8JPQ9_DERPT|nr:hypothetical protein DERP_013020 [Dermatophagoides pteronyssinus]